MTLNLGQKKNTIISSIIFFFFFCIGLQWSLLLTEHVSFFWSIAAVFDHCFKKQKTCNSKHFPGSLRIPHVFTCKHHRGLFRLCCAQAMWLHTNVAPKAHLIASHFPLPPPTFWVKYFSISCFPVFHKLQNAGTTTRWPIKMSDLVSHSQFQCLCWI